MNSPTAGCMPALVRIRSPLIVWFSAVMLFACVCPVRAARPQAVLGPPTSPPTKAVGLADYLDLGVQQHPRIAAQRASLAAAEDGQRALEKLHAVALVTPEMPLRRRQAELGVRAAAAGLDQAQRETVHNITYSYLTLLYARDQERVARSVVDRVTATRDAAKKSLDAGARDVTATDVNRASVYVRLAETRRLQAAQGVKRALAALTEAVGFGADARLDPPPGSLPVSDAQPLLDDVVASALARRAELIRAILFAEVVCLEVEAQGTSPLQKRMETFAAGSDIHAAEVPQKEHNGVYRPGAIAPEMPTLLAGSRNERVKRSQSFHARAHAVVEATRNLITLEARDAYLRWEEASLQAREAREASAAAESLAKDLNKDFTAGLKVKVEEVVNAWVLVSQARSQYNEALYKQLRALADLERITAGGFCARLTDLPAPAPKSK